METEANLLAKTRLKAPIRVGSGPSVDAIIRVEGKPRQIVASTVVLMSSAITGHDARTRTICSEVTRRGTGEVGSDWSSPARSGSVAVEQCELTVSRKSRDDHRS